MARQPEAAVVAKIREAILAEYPTAYVVKIVGHPAQQSGIPDLLLCIGGRMVGLEVKKRRPGESEEHARGRSTWEQDDHLDRLRKAGGVGAVVLSPAEALEVLRAVELHP